MTTETVTETEGQATPDTALAEAAPSAAPEVAPEALTAAPLPGGVEAPPTFNPDFKYTFDGQQKELDAFWRPLIKDQETQKKVIDAVQRAEALDSWKGRASDAEKTVDVVKQLDELYEKGDHERVLSSLGYTDDMLYAIVMQKLQREKWSPEQKQSFEEKSKLALENEKLLTDNQKYQQDLQRDLQNKTDFEIDALLGRSEHLNLVQAYDRAHGSGTFKNKVKQVGDAMVRGAGKHIEPAEVLKEVIREYAPFLSARPDPVAAPKVIPKVNSGSGSPGKQAITSIEDLKKIRSAKYAQSDNE